MKLWNKRNDFIRLNKEWIETYFTIEVSDIETFSLYRKLGFAEIPLRGNAYERCDILMEWKNRNI